MSHPVALVQRANRLAGDVHRVRVGYDLLARPLFAHLATVRPCPVSRHVRDLQPQHRQRDQHPVSEHQLVAAAGSRRAAALLAAAAAQVRLPARLPRDSQLGHHLAQVMTGDPDEGRMTQGRTSP